MSKMLLCNARYLVSRPGPPGGIFEDGAVYIVGPLVGDVGRSADLEARYLHLPGLEVIDMKDKIILPGLVDAHNHVGEAHTLLVEGWLDTPIRGIVDATDRIYWPAYGWLTEESTYDLTLFGLLNVLKHGATTHADAMIFPDVLLMAVNTYDKGDTIRLWAYFKVSSVYTDPTAITLQVKSAAGVIST